MSESNVEEVSLAEQSGEQMAEKLQAAGHKAETQKRQRRERAVPGAELAPQLEELARSAGLTFTDKSGYHKVTGAAKKRTIYLAKKGGQVALSGFTIEDVAVRQISAEQAQKKHMGLVRGQLDFSKPAAEVLAAYAKALAELQVVAVEESPTAAETTTETAPA